MNVLNVFNQSYSPWKYPSNWIRNGRLFFRQFKWAFQRVTRGFCDTDVWDLDSHLTEYLAQTIEYLAKTSISYPGTKEFPTPESWTNYLMEIVNKLKYAVSDVPNEYEEAWLKTWNSKSFEEVLNNRGNTPEEQKIIDDFLNKENENELSKIKAQNEALVMIFHVYNQLWD